MKKKRKKKITKQKQYKKKKGVIFMFIIRIFNQKLNMDPAYYEGNEDIKLEIRCQSMKELKAKWEELYTKYEGETYAIRDTLSDSGVIVAGIYDTNDIEFINGYMKYNPYLVRLFNKKDCDAVLYYTGEEDICMEAYCHDEEHVKHMLDKMFRYNPHSTYVVWDLEDECIICGGKWTGNMSKITDYFGEKYL